MEKRRRLIVFARVPELGQVKTRLAADLGESPALAIYRSLAEHTVALARRVPNCEVEVRYIPADGHDVIARWLGTDLLLRPQGAGDLGERMSRAIDEAFQEGLTAVAVIGTDCPSLSPDVVERAFERLDNGDIVFGPASDGGYYLIALRAPYAVLFEDIPWSSSETLRRTLAVASERGLRTRLLEEHSDIDTGEDWHLWLSRSNQTGDQKAAGQND